MNEIVRKIKEAVNEIKHLLIKREWVEIQFQMDRLIDISNPQLS
jgi:hypothetical protein